MKKIQLLLLFILAASPLHAESVGLYKISDIKTLQVQTIKTAIVDSVKNKLQGSERAYFWIEVSTATSGDKTLKYITSQGFSNLIYDSTTKEILIKCSTDIEQLSAVSLAISSGKVVKLGTSQLNKYGWVRDTNFWNQYNTIRQWENARTIYEVKTSTP